MGCILGKEATEEQQQDICKEIAKEMANLCVEPAILRADKIEVKIPEELKGLLETSEKLKKLQEDSVKGKPEEPAAADGGIAGFLQKGLAVVGGALGESFAASFGVGADMLDSSVKALEGPMSTIAKDLITSKKEVILKVMSNHIVGSPVEGAAVMCRGESKTAISEHFTEKAVTSLAKQLMAECGDTIKNHEVIKAWEVTVNQVNKVIGIISSAGLADTLKLKPIELDVKMYICEQTVVGLGQQMAAEEQEIRKDPRGRKVGYPAIFCKVFTKQKLLESDWRQVSMR